MPKTTVLLSKTTAASSYTGVLDETLRALKLTGNLLLCESYSAPWAVSVPDSKRLEALLGADKAVRVVAFHLVEYGRCDINLGDGGQSMALMAGDIALCFGGQAHRIGVGHAANVQAVADLLAGAPNRQHPTITHQSADSSLICGVFLLHQTDVNPLLSALPDWVQTSVSKAGDLHNLSGIARLLAEEVKRSAGASSYVTERLLEVLCVESVRAYVENFAVQEVGWFRGLKDPVVGRAIANIHQRPSHSWTVDKIAQGVALSPSRLAARFVEAMGLSPMAYVAQWRMNVACRKLTDSRLTVDQISAEVGYESPAAFNRAFKNRLGFSPAAWRSQRAAA
jgi:AraC-like DNA-binding protein